MLDPSSIQAARAGYRQHHYDAIPLLPGTKRPASRRWQNLPADQQWKYAPDEANIAIRCGGGVAVIDADDKNTSGTSESVLRYFSGLGLSPGDYPLVKTLSGGLHFYIDLVGHLEGDYCHLASAIGAGEFRYNSGAYVVAPPSIVDGTSYVLVNGDFRQRPQLLLKDVLPLLSDKRHSTAASCRMPKISREAWKILKGENLEKFKSRSEAEQALIVSLLNTGHDRASILSLFHKYPCAGKFREIWNKDQETAMGYFSRSFYKASMWARSNESADREQARLIRDWAETLAWPGRTGRTDRALFLAHVSIAFEAGSLQYAASCRILAEKSGVSFKTAFNATRRLLDAKLLSLVMRATAELATVYRLMPNLHTSTTLPHYEEVCKFAGITKG